MRRLIALSAVVCAAGCQPAHPGGAADPPRAAKAPAANPCVRAPAGDLARPGPFAVRRRPLQATRRSAITHEERRLDPVAWFPARAHPCRAPLVLMSHGHNGAPDCERLCGHLASLGFVVIAPRHPDQATARGLQAVERVDDLEYVLAHLRRLAPTPVGAVGAAGHSFGGRTAVELAAQEPRVRAVVTMAGGADRATTATVTAPTLMLAGGADTVDPPALSVRSAKALPRGTPRRVLVVPAVGHRGLRDAPASIRAASAWLLTHLGGSRTPDLQPLPGRARMEPPMRPDPRAATLQYMNTTAPSPTRSGPSTAALVAAAAVGLLSLIVLAFGSVLLYGNSKKNDDGYLSTASHRLHTSTSAIATDDLDIDTLGSGWLIDEDRYGKIELTAKSNDGKPVFVGIARSRDAQAYLKGTDHTTLRDVDFAPFTADYRAHPAERSPGAPASHSIWVASSQGDGRQAVKWDVKHGSWSIVVMNADGSRGVDADVSAGAEVPILGDAGWGLTGIGLLLLVLTGGLAFASARLRRR